MTKAQIPSRLPSPFLDRTGDPVPIDDNDRVVAFARTHSSSSASDGWTVVVGAASRPLSPITTPLIGLLDHANIIEPQDTDTLIGSPPSPLMPISAVSSANSSALARAFDDRLSPVSPPGSYAEVVSRSSSPKLSEIFEHHEANRPRLVPAHFPQLQRPIAAPLAQRLQNAQAPAFGTFKAENSPPSTSSQVPGPLCPVALQQTLAEIASTDDTPTPQRFTASNERHPLPAAPVLHPVTTTGETAMLVDDDDIDDLEYVDPDDFQRPAYEQLNTARHAASPATPPPPAAFARTAPMIVDHELRNPQESDSNGLPSARKRRRTDDDEEVGPLVAEPRPGPSRDDNPFQPGWDGPFRRPMLPPPPRTSTPFPRQARLPALAATRLIRSPQVLCDARTPSSSATGRAPAPLPQPPTPTTRPTYQPGAAPTHSSSNFGRHLANLPDLLPQASGGPRVLRDLTPRPPNGFPPVHTNHSLSFLRNIDPEQARAWLRMAEEATEASAVGVVVPYAATAAGRQAPELAMRILDDLHNLHGIPEAELAAAIPAHTGNGERRQPVAFLLFNVNADDMHRLVSLRLSSSRTSTFSVLPLEWVLPRFLSTLVGFTTSRAAAVREAIIARLSQQDALDFLATLVTTHEELSLLPIDVALEVFFESLEVVRLPIRERGGIPAWAWNAYADPPTSDPFRQVDFQVWFRTLVYTTLLYGTGRSRSYLLCSGCHAHDHPRGLCPFPQLPGWNGPSSSLNSSSSRNNNNDNDENDSSQRRSGSSRGRSNNSSRRSRDHPKDRKGKGRQRDEDEE